MNESAHETPDGTGKATLYVVATPLGNLRDVTLRALDVLRQVDVIAAEDTRMTARLLERHGIHTRLMAVHEHNERQRGEAIVGLLAAGQSVALVTDAGTPAVSDPGAKVVTAVRAAGLSVSPIPGPAAVTAALSVSGYTDPHFLFYGFLPARHGERVAALKTLATQPWTLVFYEAPHRVVECVRDLAAELGAARQIFIARELTKRFESLHVCALGEAADWLAADDNRQRGEFVLAVTGAPAAEGDDGEARRILAVLLEELPVKQAVGLAVKLTGGRRNELYALALALKGE